MIKRFLKRHYTYVFNYFKFRVYNMQYNIFLLNSIASCNYFLVTRYGCAARSYVMRWATQHSFLSAKNWRQLV